MPAFLTLATIKSFAKRHGIMIFVALVAAAMIGSAIFLYQRGHTAGENAVQVRVERQHTETVREVRSDEKLAQTVADTTGVKLANTIEQQRVDTDQKLKEIQDALSAAPAAVAACPAVPASVLASSNALVDRANRAASPAEPAR